MVQETKYGMIFEDSEIQMYLSGVKNKIYKLLPLREEELDWDKYLSSILIELNGFNNLFSNKIEVISILSKLEGLRDLENFMLYRRTIFECLNSIDDLR